MKDEEIEKRYWTMEEVSAITGMAESHIRFYDKELSLNMKRTHGGKRLITANQVDMLLAVCDLRRFFHLNGIRQVLQAGCLEEVKILLNIKKRGRPSTSNQLEEGQANG